MGTRPARAIQVQAAGTGLLVAAAVAWFAVTRGAADLEDVGPVAFAGAWTVMMASMMLPSLVPAARAVVDVAGRGGGRGSHFAVASFTTGYLSIWTGFGLAAAGLLWAGRAAGLAFGGRVATGGILLAAAAYEVTPVKDACLRRCRHPLGFVVRHWRPGRLGAARIGSLQGAWCAACCWALMACLLALGAMSIGWMLLVAAFVAVEKLAPRERLATGGVAAALVTLAVLEVAA